MEDFASTPKVVRAAGWALGELLVWDEVQAVTPGPEPPRPIRGLDGITCPYSPGGELPVGTASMLVSASITSKSDKFTVMMLFCTPVGLVVVG